jgi:hypothetical protein
MYSGRDIFSTCYSRHAEFDEKIDHISGNILIQFDKQENVMINCNIFKKSLQNGIMTYGPTLWTIE